MFDDNAKHMLDYTYIWIYIYKYIDVWEEWKSVPNEICLFITVDIIK